MLEIKLRNNFVKDNCTLRFLIILIILLIFSFNSGNNIRDEGVLEFYERLGSFENLSKLSLHLRYADDKTNKT